MSVADGGEGRCEHNAANAGITRGAQNAERALACGDDELVFVLRHARRQRRGNVQHIVAAVDGLRPAAVLFGVGDEKREPVQSVRADTAGFEHGADVRLAL